MKFAVVDTRKVTPPEYYEETTTGKNYVMWGRNNAFPAEINEMYKGSATLRAVIDGTVNYICGNGLSIKAEKWANEVNRKGETMQDLIEEIATDLLKYNGIAIQVIYNKLGEIAELYALDFGRCRISADGKKVYYAKRWGAYTSKYSIYDVFDRNKIDPQNPTQIFWWKGAARTTYPMPTWEGAFRDCLSEIAASKYVLNNIANGLAAKTIITLPNTTGLMTDDEKKKVEKEIRTRFTGPDADSEFFLYFQNDQEDKITVDTIDIRDESNKFNAIKSSARENIFIAFRATPALFGLPNKNNGFTQQEFAEAFALYQRTQVQHYQKKIERAINRIIAMEDGITILPFSLEDQEEE